MLMNFMHDFLHCFGGIKPQYLKVSGDSYHQINNWMCYSGYKHVDGLLTN